MKNQLAKESLWVSGAILIVYLLIGYLLGGGGWHAWQLIAPSNHAIISLGKADELLLWLNPIALLVFQGRGRGEDAMTIFFITPIIGAFMGTAVPLFLSKFGSSKKKILKIGIICIVAIVVIDFAISLHTLKISIRENSDVSR